MKICDDKTHNFIVIIYSFSIAFIAMLTEDLSLILGIYSSFCENFLDFFLPAVLVYYAIKSKGSDEPILNLVSKVWFIIGFLYWATAQYYALKRLDLV